MRQLRRAIVALIACISLVIAGCGAHRCPVSPRLSTNGRAIVDVHVYVGPEFTERERDNIVNGILMWERSTNGLVVWHMLPYDPKTRLRPRGESTTALRSGQYCSVVRCRPMSG